MQNIVNPENMNQNMYRRGVCPRHCRKSKTNKCRKGHHIFSGRWRKKERMNAHKNKAKCKFTKRKNKAIKVSESIKNKK